jgi:hypothetical protein
MLTASGQRPLFPLVERIAAMAPRLDDWKFVGLKPAMGFEFSTNFEGVHLDPKKMWFMPLRHKSDPKFLGFRIAVGANVDPQDKETRGAVFIVLDTGLGERFVAENIDYVEICTAPADPRTAGYGNLLELREYIEARKKKEP